MCKIISVALCYSLLTASEKRVDVALFLPSRVILKMLPGCSHLPQTIARGTSAAMPICAVKAL